MFQSRNPLVLLSISVLVVVSLLNVPVCAKYGGGSGTAQDPYRIATAADLITLGETPGDYDKHFMLTADIDLDPKLAGRKAFDRAVIAPDTNDMAIWFQGTPFSGVFDGNRHTFSHLTIKGGEWLGVFGRLAPSAQVKNLGVLDAQVAGSASNVGGLVGWNDGGAVTQCYSTGAVSGAESNAGGLVGWNCGGTVTQCYSTAVVSGGWEIGGLVGENDEGTVTQCYSTGTVSGTESGVGGLVGYNDEGAVTLCDSTGVVSGTGPYSCVGGLVGWNRDGTVTQCYSTGVVNGGWKIGGLVGENDEGIVTQCYSTGAVSGTESGAESDVGGLVGINGGNVTQCYSTGKVSGIQYVGGLVGENWGRLTQCYSTGAVSGSFAVGGLVGENPFGSVTQCYSTGRVSGIQYVGGLVGDGSSQSVTASFWDTQTSGQTKSAGGTGKITSQMQVMQTYLNAGWDFIGELENGYQEVWEMPNGGGYPVLAVFHPGRTLRQLQGAGTAENPYLICSTVDLAVMVHYNASAHYRLAASIDLSGIRWSVPVIPAFAGTFDGDGHTISHLTIQGGDYLGLFGKLMPGVEVKDLGVVDVNVTGSGDYVGGLVGYNDGTVAQCYSTGTISGGDFVGGLVGFNGGTVAQCYSTGTVSGNSSVGGLVGWNNSSLSIAMSVITACFWDTQTSGQAASAGGTGKTTAEMKTAKTFLDAGWDFVGETKNGTQDIWWIDEGKDYPHLWWERSDGASQ
jgi:hypothetical protein